MGLVLFLDAKLLLLLPQRFSSSLRTFGDVGGELNMHPLQQRTDTYGTFFWLVGLRNTDQI